jgi:hypothetical protein
MKTQKSAAVILLSFFMLLLYSNAYYLETASRFTMETDNVIAGREIAGFMNIHADKKDRILIEHAPGYEHFEIVVSSQEPLRFIYSVRNRLKPINEEKYSGISINYFLVKSKNMKEELKKRRIKKVFEQNGWELYSDKSSSAGID